MNGFLRRRVLALLAAALTVSKAAAAPAAPPVFSVGARRAPLQVFYQLDLRDTRSHQIQVLMTVPDAPAGLEIQFPAWNALYQIRDFVRDVENVRASCGGRPAALVRLDLETWKVPDTPCAQLEIRYAVFANQEAPFGAVLNERHAFLNLALLLFYLPEERSRAVRVRFLLPPKWKLATLLDPVRPPTDAHMRKPSDVLMDEYVAENYDALADRPTEAGDFSKYHYQQSGAEYRVIVDAEPADYSAERLLDALEKITATETALMRDVPFRRYTFLFHFPRQGGGGGMEHSFGTAINVPASDVRDNWVGLEATVAHEFFHLWNVKRIRPAGLEPVDYVHGNDTRGLWFSEGVTSTYQELVLLRAGLVSRPDFYRRFAWQIATLEDRPARLFQSAEEAGREAWLERYLDYFRPERSISYYNKGEILGFLLDLAIRAASRNRHSLDDLMRRLNDDFAKRGRLFTDADLRQIVAELAPEGLDVNAFFRDYVTGTKELDYRTDLGYAGLRLVKLSAQQAALGFRAERGFTGPVEVVSVDPESNAARAGLLQGDILLEMNHQPLHGLPEDLLSETPGGQRVEFQVSRGGRTFDVAFQLAKVRTTAYRIEEISGASPEQHLVRQGWLEGKTN